MRLNRRSILNGAVSLALLATLAGCGGGTSATEPESDTSNAALTRLEKKFDATLGVYAVDTGSGEEIAHHADDRFGFASTFKVMAAGAILQKYGLDGLDERVEYSKDDLQEYAPIAEKHVETGMTLKELCDAAVRYSDNTAANLLLEHLDGPKGLEKALRKLGDDVTSIEHDEPGLNEVEPEDPTDTTTPRAFAADLREFILGDALDKAEREQLTEWFQQNTTGDTLIRAGVPDDWTVGDKSGNAGVYGIRNDIGVLWPSKGDPIVLAIMSKRDDKDAGFDDKLIAEAAEATVAELK